MIIVAASPIVVPHLTNQNPLPIREVFLHDKRKLAVIRTQVRLDMEIHRNLFRVRGQRDTPFESKTTIVHLRPGNHGGVEALHHGGLLTPNPIDLHSDRHLMFQRAMQRNDVGPKPAIVFLLPNDRVDRSRVGERVRTIVRIAHQNVATANERTILDDLMTQRGKVVLEHQMLFRPCPKYYHPIRIVFAHLHVH